MPRVNRDSRTPAHFRALRTALGIERRDLADLLDAHIHSVRAWDYHATAPDDAWAVLDTQARRLQDYVDTTLNDADRESGPVTLTAYVNDTAAQEAGMTVPAAWHLAAVGHAVIALKAKDREVRILYIPQQDRPPTRIETRTARSPSLSSWAAPSVSWPSSRAVPGDRTRRPQDNLCMQGPLPRARTTPARMDNLLASTRLPIRTQVIHPRASGPPTRELSTDTQVIHPRWQRCGNGRRRATTGNRLLVGSPGKGNGVADGA